MQWVEKYRPKTLTDITSQDNIINALKNTLINKNLPHLIFYGPSGCGKTSTIIALAKQIFGSEYWSDRIIELNASDERGINIVRDKIKMFAKKSIKLNDNIPPWKIIILDEADTMTSDSQFALRRIIEEYSKITRFCIICNYHDKIIEPIISRCSLFSFKPINNNNIIERLNEINLLENSNIDKKLLEKISIISRGDLRKAINLLQNCNNSYDTDTNEELLYEFSGFFPLNKFEKLFEFIFKKDLINIDLIIEELYINGYSIVNQIIIFHDYIVNNNLLTDKQKSNILNKITDVDQHLIKGCDEYIQFIRLIYYIVSVI
jgi:replication factor C subunit 2/4